MWKVGDLARRTGVPVRTLHHYHAVGLLVPSGSTGAGYRLYTAADVARLQQVLSLRQLGLSLDEIRACLDRPDFSPVEVLERHAAQLREQIDAQQRLRSRLDTLAGHLRAAGEVSADEFLGAIEEMTMLETLAAKYFTPAQADAIQKGREEAGPEALNRMQEEWADLIAALRTEMDRGTDPAAPAVQALARRWQALLTRSTGGDPDVQQAMKKLWEEQGDALAAKFGAKYDSRPVWGYVEAAIRHAAGGRSFVSFDGTRIAYSDEGTGPAVLLLHGFGMSGRDNFGPFDGLLPKLEQTREAFREAFGAAPPLPAPPAEGRPGLAARLLAAGARVIVPDLRGFGDSDQPRDAAAYANAAMARDVVALVNQLGLAAVDVLGYSMGAVTVARLLALGAPAVRAAVIAGAAQYLLEGELMDLPERYPVPDGLSRPFTITQHAEALAKALDGGPSNSPSAVLVRSTGGDPVVLAAAIRGAVAEPVPVEPLRKANVPTLILNGTADLANRAVAKLLDVLPNARAAACDGDHHSAPWQPSFQRAVVDFLAERWPNC